MALIVGQAAVCLSRGNVRRPSLGPMLQPVAFRCIDRGNRRRGLREVMRLMRFNVARAFLNLHYLYDRKHILKYASFLSLICLDISFKS